MEKLRLSKKFEQLCLICKNLNLKCGCMSMLKNAKSKEIDFGAFVISLDFEIHWGVRDIYPANSRYTQNLLGVRQAIPRILDLFEEFDIGATWATVGFLFANSRQEIEDFSPKIRPNYEDVILSPYEEIIGEDEINDPFHYAPSLIKAIAERKRQEIGTHTFSHYYCLEQGQARSGFKADLESALSIAQKYGFQIKSIVFPRNQFNDNYADILLDAGILCYRGNETGWIYRPSTTKDEQKLAIFCYRWLDRYFNLSGFNLTGWSSLIQQNGLCNIPSSRFLRAYAPRWKYLEPLLINRITHCIYEAAIHKKIFHLWWHPHNFGIYIDENIRMLRKILEAFSVLRKNYNINSLNMMEIARIVYVKGM